MSATSPRRGSPASPRTRAIKDRKPNSPTRRSSYSPRNSLRWTAQTKVHDCSRNSDLKLSPDRAKERLKVSDSLEKKGMKVHEFHGNNKSADLNGTPEWRSRELGKKDRDIDSMTYICSPSNSRERNMDSDLGVKKTERDVKAYLNSSYGSSDRRKAEENGMSEKSKMADTDDIDFTSSRKSKVIDFENATIAKQRTELQLLISELKDRDRELNEMVLSHQRQIGGWDADKKKITVLEERCVQYEKEMQLKNDEIRKLVAKLNTVQSEDQNKATALTNTRHQLSQVTEQHTQEAHKLQVLTEKYNKAKAVVKEQDDHITQMESRERELLDMLKNKDKDLSESSSNMAQLNSKIQLTEQQNQEAKRTENELRRQVGEWKNKQKEIWKEYEHSKRELVVREQAIDELKMEVQRYRQEVSTLKKEIMLSGERERRKGQLLELQKSKQDRTESELTHIRTLYERQQKETALIQLNLENTKDLLQLHQKQNLPGFSSSTANVDAPLSTYPSEQFYEARSSPRSEASSSHLSQRYSHHHMSPRGGVMSPRGVLSPRGGTQGDEGHSHPVLPEPPEVKEQDTSLTTEDSFMAQHKYLGDSYTEKSGERRQNPLEESLVSDVVDDYEAETEDDYARKYLPLSLRHHAFMSSDEDKSVGGRYLTETGTSSYDAAEIDRILTKHLGARYSGGKPSEDKDHEASAPILGQDRFKSHLRDDLGDVTASAPDMISRGSYTSSRREPRIMTKETPFHVGSDEGPTENGEGGRLTKERRNESFDEEKDTRPEKDMGELNTSANSTSPSPSPKMAISVSDHNHSPMNTSRSNTPRSVAEEGSRSASSSHPPSPTRSRVASGVNSAASTVSNSCSGVSFQQGSVGLDVPAPSSTNGDMDDDEKGPEEQSRFGNYPPPTSSHRNSFDQPEQVFNGSNNQNQNTAVSEPVFGEQHHNDTVLQMFDSEDISPTDAPADDAQTDRQKEDGDLNLPSSFSDPKPHTKKYSSVSLQCGSQKRKDARVEEDCTRSEECLREGGGGIGNVRSPRRIEAKTEEILSGEATQMDAVSEEVVDLTIKDLADIAAQQYLSSSGDDMTSEQLYCCGDNNM